MFWSMASLFLQLGLKVLPVLHQLKILKTEAELKEMQRRFEAAIRKCEEGALDPVLVRKQHEENEKQLEEEWNKKWGKKWRTQLVTFLERRFFMLGIGEIEKAVDVLAGLANLGGGVS